MTALRSGSSYGLRNAIVVAALIAGASQVIGAEPTVKLLSADIRHESTIRTTAFSPDGKLLAVGGGKGIHRKPNDPPSAELSVWDVTTRTKRVTLEGHTDSIWTVAFSPDGKTLASGSFDKTVRLWDVATGKELAVLKDSPCGVFSVAFSPDGKTLAGSVWVCFDKEMKADWSKPGTVLLWDVATQKVRTTLKVDIGAVKQLAFSPDGKTLATAARKLDAKKDQFVSGEVWFWDVATGKHTDTLKAHPAGFSAFAYSPDGKTLATAGDQWDEPEPSPGRVRVKLWDTATLKFKASESFFESAVSGLAFSSDNKMLAVGGGIWDWPYLGAVSLVRYGEATLVDAANLKEIAKLPRQDSVEGIAFRPNEKVFATIAGNELKLWELTEKR